MVKKCNLTQKMDTEIFEFMKCNNCTHIFVGHNHNQSFDSAYKNINCHYNLKFIEKYHSILNRWVIKLLYK